MVRSRSAWSRIFGRDEARHVRRDEADKERAVVTRAGQVRPGMARQT